MYFVYLKIARGMRPDFALLLLLDRLCALNDFFNPLVVLRVELIGPEAVLSAPGTDDGLIVHVQGDAVIIRHLLGEYRFLVALDLPEMPLRVDDPVKTDVIEPEQPPDIRLGTEGGGIDPDLVAQTLQLTDKPRGTQAETFGEHAVERKRERRFGLVGPGGDEQHLIQIKGNSHIAFPAFPDSDSSFSSMSTISCDQVSGAPLSGNSRCSFVSRKICRTLSLSMWSVQRYLF